MIDAVSYSDLSLVAFIISWLVLLVAVIMLMDSWCSNISLVVFIIISWLVELLVVVLMVLKLHVVAVVL